MSIEINIENLEQTLINVISSEDLVTNDKLILSVIIKSYIDNTMKYLPSSTNGSIEDYLSFSFSDYDMEKILGNDSKKIHKFVVKKEELLIAFEYMITEERVKAIKHLRKYLAVQYINAEDIAEEIIRLKNSNNNNTEIEDEALEFIEGHKKDFLARNRGLKVNKYFLDVLVEKANLKALNDLNNGLHVKL